jgi:hypothetical protein
MQKTICWSWLLVLALSLPVAALKKKAKDVKQAAKSVVAAPVVNGWRNEEAKFAGHGVTLAGTFTFPKTTAPKKTPAVLLLGAFGATPRDGVQAAANVLQPIYKDLAEHLAGQGFVTLRFDKRCAGASTCRANGSFEELVDDAKAAYELVRARPEVDPSKIFLFGHSEGGLIASVVAAGDHKVAGLVMAASPGRSLNKILREQSVTRMREAGESTEKISAFTTKFDLFSRVMMAGDMSQMTLSFDAKDANDVMMQSLAKQPAYTAPMFINDPLMVPQGITCPVLILQGDKDLQITVRDAQFINEAFTRVHHPDTTFKLLPDVDHLLKSYKGAAKLALAQDTKQPLDASVLAALNEWLSKRK